MTLIELTADDLKRVGGGATAPKTGSKDKTVSKKKTTSKDKTVAKK